MNLLDKNISYLIASPEKDDDINQNKFLCDKMCNLLYSKEYDILSLTSYYKQKYDKSFLCMSQGNNDTLRKESIFLIDEFDLDYVIIKYKNEDFPKKILKDGSEKLLELKIYENSLNNKFYIFNGVSFSFMEKKRYKLLTDKKDIRRGMIIEFYNNDKWDEKKVENVDIEYEKMYKLLMKYQKLRICVD